MPLYEYQCDACGVRFERIQKFSDPKITECPTCGGPVHKLFSSPAIQFKGSGFYITDYAKKSDSATTRAGKSESSESSKESGSKDASKSNASTSDSKSSTGSSSGSSDSSSSSSSSNSSTGSSSSTSSTGSAPKKD